MKRKKLKYTNHMITISISVIILLLFLMPNDHIKLTGTTLSPLNDGWTIDYRDTTEFMQSLPLVLNLNPNEPYTIYRLLPEDFPKDTSIRIRSSMQHIKVYLNDEFLMETLKPDTKGPVYAPEVSAWYVIQLPPNSAQKTLKLTITTPINIMSGRVNEIYYGFSSGLQADLLRSNILGVGISIVILGIGCLTTIIAFVVLV